MQELLAIAKALSDSNRVRALKALAAGELCLCQIIEMLKLAPSTVSKHMAILHQAGLIQTRKEGRWMYYRLPTVTSAAIVKAALDMVKKCTGDDVAVRQDERSLPRIRRANLDALCACYRK
jgi:ArsR family transcriptional regulator, arsenate/arsenite/antimonite-responsive transcriptional repressor